MISLLNTLRDADRDATNKDLMIVDLVATRNKTGQSGTTFEIFISQTEGLLPVLTMFNYIKEQGGYGLNVVGNNISFASVFLPDVKFGRTTVRTTIDTNYKLQRAIEIAAQMRQMEMLWSGLDPALHCKPEELYEDLKKAGYDWDILLGILDHTGCFRRRKANDKYYLSTMDLLRARAGLYEIYWYKDAVKNKTKSKGR